MRVLCINNKNPLQPRRILPQDLILEGEIYHVLDEMVFPEGLHYALVEKVERTGRKVYYQANRFVPLGDDEVTEEELKEEYLGAAKQEVSI